MGGPAESRRYDFTSHVRFSADRTRMVRESAGGGVQDRDMLPWLNRFEQRPADEDEVIDKWLLKPKSRVGIKRLIHAFLQRRTSRGNGI